MVEKNKVRPYLINIKEVMSLFFSTTPNPSSQEEGTTGGGFSLLLGGDHRLPHTHYGWGTAIFDLLI